MMSLFSQTANQSINITICSDFIKRLPVVIRKHTDWDYSCEQTDTGCFLKPTFRNMPYRNAFVPEIDIVVSCHDEYTSLRIIGRPVKPVRNFMVLWFIILLTMEVFSLLAATTSHLDNLFLFIIPLVMCAFGYLLCKLGTKAAFHSVVKAIQRDFS